MSKVFNIIGAFCKSNRGIGLNNKLPWKVKEFPQDMKRFIQITKSVKDNSKINSVIMGRNTWESLKKPLESRFNIIVSSKLNNLNNNNIKIFNNLEDALNFSYNNKSIESTFVIGGQKIYQEAILRKDCKFIYTTEIQHNSEADTYFPEIPKNYKLHEDVLQEEKVSFKTYKNILDLKSQEYQYLDYLRKILDSGEEIKDRTGVGTLSLFDANFNYKVNILNPETQNFKDLVYQVPVLTTKKLYINGVIWELLWFLLGQTDAKWLQDRKVHIWDGHSSKKYLESLKLNYQEGEIGPGYGHQWIRWGGDWFNKTGGINQIQYVIDELKKNPASRRAVLSAWNISDVNKTSLPPCHVMYLFKVTDHNKIKKLNCKMIMRSNDLFLGNPFNVLSTTLLTILISRVLNMHVGEIALNICDAHIYKNHIEQVKEQLSRTPYEFPKLKISKDITSYEDMIKLTPEDFKFTDYYSYDTIKAEMAI